MKQRMLQKVATYVVTFCRGQTFKGNQEGIFQVVHDQTNELENHHRCWKVPLHRDLVFLLFTVVWQ